MTITLESVPSGYRVWKDTIYLVANVTTKDDHGQTRDNPVKDAAGNIITMVKEKVLEPMPHGGWGIHFTSPEMNVEELQAVVAALPTGP